jgi:hypothetical protein
VVVVAADPMMSSPELEGMVEEAGKHGGAWEGEDGEGRGEREGEGEWSLPASEIRNMSRRWPRNG